MAEATKEQLKELTDQEFDPTEIETLAMESGWSPKADWRGDGGEEWIDAPEFVRQGTTRLKKTLAKQDKQLVGMKTLEDTLGEVKEHMIGVDKRAYDKAVKDLKVKQREAVEEGDTEKYDDVQSDIDDLDKEAVSSQTKANNNVPVRDPDFDAWIVDNKWYNTDVFLTSKADAEIGPTVRRMYPDLIGRPLYDMIAEQVRGAYPEKFGKSSRTRPSSVEGAGAGGAPQGSGKKSYADLPQDAKEACDRFVEVGVMTKEAYLSTYDWDTA